MPTTVDGQHNADPLNHHKVPQTYLKGFDSGQGIIVYDAPRACGLGRLISQVKNPRVATKVKNLAAEIDYYTYETPNGPDYCFERGFTRIENLYPLVMKAVRSGKPLMEKELGMLALLAAMQDGRVRRMELVELMKGVRETTRLLLKHHHPQLSEDEIATETDEAIRRDILKAEIPSPRNIALAAVGINIEFSFDVFSFMYKCILESKTRNFVTSDSPVTWIDPAQFPENPRHYFRLSGFMELTFPLNRRYCLVMSWNPMKQRLIAEEDVVGIINARTASAARAQIFATNTGNESDRLMNARDFTIVRSWMGVPISLILADEAAQLSDADGARLW